MRKRCSCCWNFSEAGVSTSDFLPIPDFPFLRECFARRPSVSTFLTVSIIVKRMVELWRFHQPAIVRDSTVSENICHHRETNRRSFPLFFSFPLPSIPSQSIFLPHSLFFIKIIHLAGIRITPNPIRSTYSKQLEASMKLSPLRNFRFYRGSVLLHLLASPSCLLASLLRFGWWKNSFRSSNLEFFNSACCKGGKRFREMNFLEKEKR